jgi:hypothetical protein
MDIRKLSKSARDASLQEIKDKHNLHPHSGYHPEVTPYTVIDFGIYKGTMIKDLPRDYLAYIAHSCRSSNSLYTNNIFDRIRQYVDNLSNTKTSQMIGTKTQQSRFLKISEGHICDYKNNKLGNYVGGYLKDIKFKNVTNEASAMEVIEITLSYQDDTYSINIPKDTIGRGFMLCLPNIDLSQIIEINAALNKEGFTYIWINQNGKTVPPYWTRENPRDKPSWELKHGKYDKSAELDYLKACTLKISQKII